MSDAPIQIRNPNVVRAIRRLAEKTGLPITDAVGEAVEAELRRRDEVDDVGYRRRRAAIREIVEELRKLPRTGPPLSDDDLYDADGLPR